jgi:hypothetical protein
MEGPCVENTDVLRPPIRGRIGPGRGERRTGKSALAYSDRDLFTGMWMAYLDLRARLNLVGGSIRREPMANKVRDLENHDAKQRKARLYLNG